MEQIAADDLNFQVRKEAGVYSKRKEMAVGLGPEECGKGLAVGYGLTTQIDIKT